MDWIDLEEQWPNDGQKILVCDSISGVVTLAKCNLDDESFDLVDLIQEITDDIFTHWMPIPEPVKI